MAIITCGPQCTFENKRGGRDCGDPVLTYDGAVLDTYEVNGYDDSDFVAIVWDAEAGRLRHVQYATTRGWTYHNGAKVDAKPEIIDAALAWFRPQWERYNLARLDEEAREVKPGRKVRSTTTRGKNKGVEGTAGLIVDGAYGVRVKVDTGTEQRWLSLDRVEVIDPVVDAEQVAWIKSLTATRVPANWRSADLAYVAAMRY
jgi:hypothetical protein